MEKDIVQRIKEKPWNVEVSTTKIPKDIKSMILWPEQKLLYWLANSYYSGNGAIADLGCFLGSSTLSLAYGLADQNEALKQRSQPIIHSYDIFVAPDDPYTLERLPSGYNPGTDFLDVYRSNIDEHKALISVHSEDIRKANWKAGPIEILFIDICKCWSTNHSVLANFYPWLIPGKSIVVQQDFVRAWNPWVPVTMAALSEYFEVLGEEESSRIYLYKKQIPKEVSQVDLREHLSFEEKYSLLERSITESSESTAAVHSGALAVLSFIEGENEVAYNLIKESRGKYKSIEGAEALYDTIIKTMDIWKTGAAYEKQMEDKF